MPPAFPSTPANGLLLVKQFTLNLNQATGTYTFATAGGGLVLVQDIAFYNDVAGTGFVTIIAATDDTTAVNLFASTAVATVTGGKQIPSLVTVPFVLSSGKHLQFTIVGTNGTGGSIQALVRYMAPSAGALS